jgi:HAD domain family 1 in Swiss Army Knife RNA repair proteins
MLSRLSSVRSIELFDDRVAHVKKFDEILKGLVGTRLDSQVCHLIELNDRCMAETSERIIVERLVAAHNEICLNGSDVVRRQNPLVAKKGPIELMEYADYSSV